MAHETKSVAITGGTKAWNERSRSIWRHSDDLALSYPSDEAAAGGNLQVPS